MFWMSTSVGIDLGTANSLVYVKGKGIVLREQSKHIPECLSESIMEKMGSVEELAAMVPAIDKLIEGLKRNNINEHSC